MNKHEKGEEGTLGDPTGYSHLIAPFTPGFLGYDGWSPPGSTVVARWCPGAVLLRQRKPDPLTTTRSCRSHPVTGRSCGHVPGHSGGKDA